MVRSAVVPLSLMLLLASPARAVAPEKLVIRHGARKAVGVDACTGSSSCSQWVSFPASPAREIIESGFSRSHAHFFVWSKADGRPMDLDVFATPTDGQGPARASAHLVPGFGGDLRWLDGERLWHTWGCGSSCVVARLYDVAGAVRFTETGSWENVAPDASRALVADYGGSIVLIDPRAPARYAIGPSPGAGFPEDVAWTPTGVTVRFYETDDRSLVRSCVPGNAGKLDCHDAKRTARAVQ